MGFVEVSRTRVLIVAVALTALSLALLRTESSATPDGPPAADRPSSAASLNQLRQVEASVAHTNIARRLKSALGSDFGGVWFEPSTAQLHVGVTSPSSRRGAEEAARAAGLSSVVSETAVESTWAELIAAQERWDDRLAGLFSAGRVQTWVSAQDNAVGIELASTVDRPAREELRRKAAADPVAVMIVISPLPSLFGESHARCAKFATDKAYCDPTIVGGVSIERESGTLCSAGPAVVREDRSKFFRATNTFIFTAGHCMAGGAPSEKWYAWSKGGTRTQLGTAVEFKHAERDIGLISVDFPTWANETLVPVNPAVAEWSATEDTEPVPVVGETEPVQNTVVCLSGQTTGTNCGLIENTNKNVLFDTGTTTKNLIEVVGVAPASGDSGGPWVSGEEAGTGLVVGTHVGHTKGANNGFFQKLELSYGALNTKVELLSDANEVRHAFSFDFGSVPVVLTGKRSGAAKHVFTTDAGTVSCGEVAFTTNVATRPVGELKVSPKYTECTTKTGAEAPVDMNGCHYALIPSAFESGNYEGKVNIICPNDKRINIAMPGCLVTLGPQVEAGKVTYTPTGTGSTSQLTVDFNLSNLVYEEHHKCPQHSCMDNTKEKTNGEYTGAEAISGETGAGAHVGVFISLNE